MRNCCSCRRLTKFNSDGFPVDREKIVANQLIYICSFCIERITSMDWGELKNEPIEW
jgi:hypothetical protein